MKKNINRINKITIISILSLLLISSFNTIAIEPIKNNKEPIEISYSENINDSPYAGYLRVYVTEPESRWRMANHNRYHYALLDIVYDDLVEIDYLDTYKDSIIWDGDVDEDNVQIIAAIFNSKVNKGYANPPSSHLFDAYYVDAAAGATPGNIGYNTVTENFTHTVFVEEGTATWCPYCPDMANKLYNISKSGEYPFYFVALVEDENEDASNRLFYDYNLYAFPTAFFDGGRKVLIGGGLSEKSFKSRIETCGKKDVHELNLTLTVDYIGGGDLIINISITNEENNPPINPVITGPTSIKKDKEYEYTIVSTDPNGDDEYYHIDWGDNTSEENIGPFNSGEEISLKHIWNEQGIFLIKVKAIDIYGAESDWTTLEISIQKFKTIKNSILELFNNHQNIFYIIRQIIMH